MLDYRVKPGNDNLVGIFMLAKPMCSENFTRTKNFNHCHYRACPGNPEKMPAYVYILASKNNVTIYTGVTNDLIRRVYEHKEKSVKSFSKQYDVDRLVYFEQHQSISNAIQREKNIKHWSRQWKLELIEKNNPEWRDLYAEIT